MDGPYRSACAGAGAWLQGQSARARLSGREGPWPCCRGEGRPAASSQQPAARSPQPAASLLVFCAGLRPRLAAWLPGSLAAFPPATVYRAFITASQPPDPASLVLKPILRIFFCAFHFFNVWHWVAAHCRIAGFAFAWAIRDNGFKQAGGRGGEPGRLPLPILLILLALKTSPDQAHTHTSTHYPHCARTSPRLIILRGSRFLCPLALSLSSPPSWLPSVSLLSLEQPASPHNQSLYLTTHLSHSILPSWSISLHPPPSLLTGLSVPFIRVPRYHIHHGL